MVKIIKGQSEAVNQRKTDNTMVKIIKGQSEAVNQRKTDNTMACSMQPNSKLFLQALLRLFKSPIWKCLGQTTQ